MYLHHVNLSSGDVTKMATFYRDVLGFEDITRSQVRIEDKYGGRVAFLDAGDGRQLHLSAVDPDLCYRTGHVVNMMTPSGHIAFRVDDIEAMKQKLKLAEVPYSDYGEWAMKGWYQICFHDPAGNVVEFHQVL